MYSISHVLERGYRCTLQVFVVELQYQFPFSCYYNVFFNEGAFLSNPLQDFYYLTTEGET